MYICIYNTYPLENFDGYKRQIGCKLGGNLRGRLVKYVNHTMIHIHTHAYAIGRLHNTYLHICAYCV